MSEDKSPNKHGQGVVTDVRVGQTLLIGSVRVTVEKKDGQRARLRVVADEGVVIQHSPQQENQQRFGPPLICS